MDRRETGRPLPDSQEQTPRLLTGTGVSPGSGYGPAYLVVGDIPEPAPGSRHDGDARAERSRAEQALDDVAADLESRGARAGGEAEEVLGAQAMMARDPGLAEEVGQLIGEGVAAPRAVFEAFGKYRELLSAAGGYLGERVADLDDIRDRAIALLTGLPLPGVPTSAAEPFVLIARDLAPADTALLSKDVVAAFVTEQGGPTSHTAILARSMGVPAVVGCAGATAVAQGTAVLVDGASGRVRLSPAEDEVAAARNADEARLAALSEVTGPGATADGHAVPLLANIGGPRDLDAALAAGAEGVGLYRTEFLFLDRDAAPTPEEQEAAYRAVFDAFPAGRVVVRTLDAGADKPLAFLPPPGEEPNPALGERGIRLFRRYPDVMTAQLGALARAAEGTSATVEIMAPMVATAEEAEWFAQACRTAGLENAGIMIEVPSAAIRAADLIQRVDFFSIGTNDLTQYALAADRQVSEVAELQDPWHPAVLDLIGAAASAASAAGKGCGVCGEAAADPVLACVLVGMGVTSLSMAAPALAQVRAVLARHTREQCRQAAAAARAATSPAEARTAARARLPELETLAL
ncbi:phosphoenolpyruvate--protein phosphotransferase [Planotetraspora kaengkrachanensis]|uniref:Phosphoenolpyruvate-protein phosphotransferase n=1 Tax=Planotetraspora kaengkrachanensis TaxID=575193 RepID=A0A8J3V829_9ACTN|nr:phosphoenolpyruvate--protein phosphotransferase [Planotetraspora kaengkrachanensis]GIG81703.1 phosphoenolpyruvate-protein phosphotransferase [Planotetraspora kaengkrachanensis]